MDILVLTATSSTSWLGPLNIRLNLVASSRRCRFYLTQIAIFLAHYHLILSSFGATTESTSALFFHLRRRHFFGWVEVVLVLFVSRETSEWFTRWPRLWWAYGAIVSTTLFGPQMTIMSSFSIDFLLEHSWMSFWQFITLRMYLRADLIPSRRPHLRISNIFSPLSPVLLQLLPDNLIELFFRVMNEKIEN